MPAGAGADDGRPGVAHPTSHEAATLNRVIRPGTHLAKLLPGDWRTSQDAPATARIASTLALLEKRLPDSFTVFHGVHWSRSDNGLASLGMIDFVVLSRNGGVLLVEQKSGWLDETADGLARSVRGATITLRVQVDRTLDGLRRRLEPLRLGRDIDIQYLLYCPDYRLKSPASAGLDPAHIVDHLHRDELIVRIQSLLGHAGVIDRPPAPSPDITRRLHRFFANELELMPDASALVGRANALFTRMSDGLATWARRFTITPHRLRVCATAGSGKTQLALALIDDALEHHQRVLYVCFNRPLADHIQRAVPADARVFSWHQWCQHRIRASGETIDFSRDRLFDWLVSRAAELPVEEADRPDCLIIDEGQDFSAGWRDDLLRLVDPAGTDTRIWWLDDPMQNLYDRDPVAPADWPMLTAMVNYRSPRTVIHFLNRRLMPDTPVRGAGPIQGRDIEFLTYTGSAELLAQTRQAITLALHAGFRREDVAVLTMVGMARSALLRLDALGPHRLRAFRGRYDLFGNPEYSDGEVMIDTVYRFKGQSAPCVVLTELDIDTLDDAARRRLFVGVTRASMHLIIVLSVRAHRLLTS